MPPYTLAWLANPLLVVSCVLLLSRKFELATWTGLVALGLALTTWLYGIPHLLAGYYLWQSSTVILTVGSLVLARLQARASPAPTKAERVLEQLPEVLPVGPLHTAKLMSAPVRLRS